MGLIGLCSHCGAPIREGERSCAYCGMPAEQPPAARSLPVYAPQPPAARRPEADPAPAQRSPARGEKNKWIAILLCLFFGVIGLHKFYEERIGMGVLYLLTGGLFGIGWVVDLIVLLFRPNPYYP